ncbi:MAG: hypothetical protein ACP5MD_01905 [Verrucomicrobiia bacterium]
MNAHALLDHWFWLLVTTAALVWYSTVTVYVAVRGLRDIRSMFRRLGEGSSQSGESSVDGGEH